MSPIDPPLATSPSIPMARQGKQTWPDSGKRSIRVGSNPAGLGNRWSEMDALRLEVAQTGDMRKVSGNDEPTQRVQ